MTWKKKKEAGAVVLTSLTTFWIASDVRQWALWKAVRQISTNKVIKLVMFCWEEGHRPIQLQADKGGSQNNFPLHSNHMTGTLHENEPDVARCHKTLINLYVYISMSTSTAHCKYLNNRPQYLEFYKHIVSVSFGAHYSLLTKMPMLAVHKIQNIALFLIISVDSY